MLEAINSQISDILEQKVTPCPSCGRQDMRPFYSVRSVPVHSVLLMRTREQAVTYPRGDITLALCRFCGFISNITFDPAAHSYSTEYEETQSFSPTFRAFHEQLASQLVKDCDLHGKTIIEIGCGKGDFLPLLCRMGAKRAIGFDPAFVAERNPADGCDIQFIADFYSDKYADYKADFICCKMTLEHIHNTFDFISGVRRAIGNSIDTRVFFQVPDARRILQEGAFWDIYYEHCSYFTAESLKALFERAGFDVLSTGLEYGDQYLTILAKPAGSENGLAGSVKAPSDGIETFVHNAARMVQSWQLLVRQMARDGLRIAVWGSGSKGVAFLGALGATDEVEYVVDINPYRQGKYMCGTGHEIVSPQHLTRVRPDVVIAMNPMYESEIRRDLDQMGIPARLLSV